MNIVKTELPTKEQFDKHMDIVIDAARERAGKPPLTKKETIVLPDRLLKFNAWDTRNKKWALSGFHIIGECTAFDLINQYKLENLCDLIVVQYTGIKDKNGKEIYEGDIVAFNPAYDDYYEGLEIDYVVYESGCYKLKKGDPLCDLINSSGSMTEDEVIGNIFENPEYVGL